MKKFYSLIALAFAAMSASADVVLTYEGKVVDPSQPLDVMAKVKNCGDETEPYVMITCGESDLKVKNTGSSAASVSFTVDTNDWKHFKWCGPMSLTDQCTSMSSSIETRSGSLKAGIEDALMLDALFGGFDEDYNPLWGSEYYATYKVTFTIKVGSDKKVYTLNFIYDASCDEKAGLSAGINTVLRGEDNAVRYDLQGRRTNSTAAGLFIQNGRKFIK